MVSEVTINKSHVRVAKTEWQTFKRLGIGALVILALIAFGKMHIDSQDRAAREDNQRQNHFAELIAQHRFAVGMTGEQVKQAIGPPDRINRTVGNGYVSEQWIYTEPLRAH